MANRTPEEIRAQREAFLAARAARAAGIVAPAPPAPVEKPVEPAPAPLPAEKPAEGDKPPPAERKRTPEELRAQREAFLAAKAARGAGKTDGAVTPMPSAEKPKPKDAEAAPKPIPAKQMPAAAKADPNITRREFLNYAWLASIALFSLETVGLSLWFAFPNFRAGQFGGAFAIGAAAEVLPEVNVGPKAYTEGKFWLVNLDTKARSGELRKGIMALYKVCTHLGCLYEWVPITNRFECPCHGSKFELTGDYISGPARRSLDRFVIQAVAADGSIKETDAEGNPLVIDGDETLNIDTGKRILGAPVA